MKTIDALKAAMTAADVPAEYRAPLVGHFCNELKQYELPNLSPQNPNSREAQMVTVRMEDGEPTVWCDPEIADLVDALNTDKLATIASCSGHGHRPGSIALKDGRWLFVATEEQRQVIEATFPVDVNGVVVPKAQAKVYDVEGALRGALDIAIDVIRGDGKSEIADSLQKVLDNTAKGATP